MAVELRCPKCKKKLRLPIDPEPDSEIECPSCEHVFPCDEHIVRAGAADDEKPKKSDGGDKPKKGKKNKDKQAAAGDQPKKRKKKTKKRKTPPAVIAAIVVGILMFVGTVGGVLIWFFTKKSSSQEMMTYLPDDCDEVFGLNVGHLSKYPEFYKSCEGTFANTGFRKAGDQLAKALGGEFTDHIEYVVQGTGRAGGNAAGQLLEATVFKTKAEFDQGAIGSIPGAKKGSANGVDYYAIPDIPELGYGGVRVFAPTNRVVVFCRADTPQAKLNAMVTGNKDNMDATAYVRSGPLGKQTIRGTVWKFTIYGRASPRPVAPKKQAGAGGSESADDQLLTEIAGVAAGAQGSGYKASVGSRETRFEWILWQKDSEAASEMIKKWKDKEWVKDSEKDPPKWMKALAQKSGAGKTAENIVRDGFAFNSSGELASVRTVIETNLLKQGVNSIVTAFTQQQSSSGGGPGGPGGGPPGGPGGPMPGPMGGMPRRRRWPHHRRQRLQSV